MNSFELESSHHRKDLAKKEKQGLSTLAYKNLYVIERALSRIRKEDIQIRCTEKNTYKLLVFRVWMEKYRIDLDFILSTLLPVWEGFVKKRNPKARKGNAFNTSIATLTGKKSEQILQEAIQKYYRNDENKTLYVSFERERILKQELKRKRRDRDSDISELRDVTEFKDPIRWARHYMRQMTEVSGVRDKIASEYMKRPYRGNPFFPERL